MRTSLPARHPLADRVNPDDGDGCRDCVPRACETCSMPVGSITRGTTNTNRLRRIDRWIAAQPALLHATDPFVVDLGYGASGVTALELAARLARVRPDVEVLGLEIDPARVRARASSSRRCAPARRTSTPDLRVDFALGGFEVPAPAAPSRGHPGVQRAAAVRRVRRRRRPGRAWRRGSRRAGCSSRARATSSAASRAGSASTPTGGRARFTISLRGSRARAPSIVAERLPKALIHRNVPGERIHELLARARPGVARARADVGLRAVAALDRDRRDGAARGAGT